MLRDKQGLGSGGEAGSRGEAGAEPGGPGGEGSPLLGVLDALLLLTDDVGDGAGNAAYQGPVLLEADAPIFVLVQVADELVSRSPVPGVLWERAEMLVLGKGGAKWGGPQMCGRSWPPRVPAQPGLTVSMWLSSQLSILRKSFLLMRRGFRQQQRLEYLSKLFTSTWMAHSSSVQSAIAARSHLQGPGLGGGCQGRGAPGHPRASRCHQGAQ